LGLANWLTIFRIVLIPVFISLLVYRRWTIALAVFVLASLTDTLDGYIARHRGRETRLGAFLDPMADKLLLTASFITLTYLKALPFWITALVLTRDVLLILGAALIHMTGGQIHPAPTLAGKATTLFQMVTVLAAILAKYFHLAPGVKNGLIWTTAALTLFSGLQYLYQGSRFMNGQGWDKPPA
jgi:cardiolipin synthase